MGTSLISWFHKRDLAVFLDPNEILSVRLKEGWVVKKKVMVSKVGNVTKRLAMQQKEFDCEKQFPEVFLEELEHLKNYVHCIKRRSGAIPKGRLCVGENFGKENVELEDEFGVESVVCVVSDGIVQEDEWRKEQGNDTKLQETDPMDKASVQWNRRARNSISVGRGHAPTEQLGADLGVLTNQTSR
ncbi:hypothetical protein NDU88_007089 [Pleurodeles waltl]|uniref:Uncharacterized protein n=1 Tax=Pleurodeles waltl TaxID=8319 RepID=A0AAV7WGN3_PLEWA|nr:hypothetical protein NDU88_007089 [Pleurodeles waltl]